MAIYGTEYLRWAPFFGADSDGDPSKFPTYGPSLYVGHVMNVEDNPAFNEVEIYGANASRENVSKIRNFEVTTGVTDLSNEIAAQIFGTEIGAEPENGVEFGRQDNPPFGGMAFIINRLVDNVEYFQGVYYPKVKAAMQGATYNTMGESITLNGDSFRMKGAVCAKGKWKVFSPRFTTLEAAETWVNAKLPVDGDGTESASE